MSIARQNLRAADVVRLEMSKVQVQRAVTLALCAGVIAACSLTFDADVPEYEGGALDGGAGDSGAVDTGATDGGVPTDVIDGGVPTDVIDGGDDVLDGGLDASDADVDGADGGARWPAASELLRRHDPAALRTPTRSLATPARPAVCLSARAPTRSPVSKRPTRGPAAAARHRGVERTPAASAATAPTSAATPTAS